MDINSQMKVSGPAGLLLLALCGASFLAGLDLFVVNVAFSDIRQSFTGESLADVSWVLNIYAIGYAALLIPLGRWSDRFGRRRGFLVGLAIFVVASLACAVSPGLWWLVAARALQAVGAAMITPASLAVILTAMPPERRASSVRVWASSAAIAAASGPVVGGFLVEASWRWVFLLNIPIGLALLALAWQVVPESRASVAEPAESRAALLLALSVGAVALALVRGGEWGWLRVETMVSFAIAALAAIAFARRNARSASPFLDPAMLRVRSYAWANAATFLFNAAFAAGLLANVLWMQSVWGYSAIRTGIAVAPGPLLVPVFALVAQRLGTRFDTGRIAAVGSLFVAAGAIYAIAAIGQEPAYVTEVLPGWLLAGVGVGLAMPTILAAGTSSLPPERTATGTAVVNMSRQIGAVLGVSLLIALLGTPLDYDAAHSSFVDIWWMTAGFAVLAAGAALGLESGGRVSERTPPPMPEPAKVPGKI